MKGISTYIIERLRISKNTKTDNITLSLWVRWYNSGNDRCIDEDEITTENIVDALSGNSNKKLSAAQLVEFYDKHKDDYLEDFKEEKQPTQTFPNGCIASFTVDYLLFKYELVESFEDFIKTYKTNIHERLSVSKALSQKTITLETFVRWCETSMHDIGHNKLIAKTIFDKNDIYDALECETAKQSGLISKDDYFDFYEKYKNDYLENLVQAEGRERVYLTFDVGGINFYIHVFGSFWKDMNNIFDINIELKKLQS